MIEQDGPIRREKDKDFQTFGRLFKTKASARRKLNSVSVALETSVSLLDGSFARFTFGRDTSKDEA